LWPKKYGGPKKNMPGMDQKHVEITSHHLLHLHLISLPHSIARAKNNLHVVLAFSPIGDAFRERLRKFPALVNCCTINWFFSWPADALYAVGKRFLHQVKVDEFVLNEIIAACPHIHSSVRKTGDKFRRDMGRINYVTPTSYLELIKTFTKQLDKCATAVETSKSRYDTGLEKLNFAGAWQ